MKKAMLYIVALMFSAGVNAASFDFVNEADVVQGEHGASPISFSSDGIGLDATGTHSGANALDLGSAAYAYLDASSGGPAGLGVCQNLSGTQCNPGYDDNVLTGEKLILTFDQDVWVTDVTFHDGDHGVAFTGTFDVVIDGVLAMSLINLSALVSLDLYGTTFEFFNSSVGAAGDGGNQFYVSTLEAVAPVPVPAALFLFAPALLGFFGLRRKATLAA